MTDGNDGQLLHARSGLGCGGVREIAVGARSATCAGSGRPARGERRRARAARALGRTSRWSTRTVRCSWPPTTGGCRFSSARRQREGDRDPVRYFRRSLAAIGRGPCRCSYRRAAHGRSGSTAARPSSSGASASNRGSSVSSRCTRARRRSLQRSSITSICAIRTDSRCAYPSCGNEHSSAGAERKTRG